MNNQIDQSDIRPSNRPFHGGRLVRRKRTFDEALRFFETGVGKTLWRTQRLRERLEKVEDWIKEKDPNFKVETIEEGVFPNESSESSESSGLKESIEFKD